MALCSGRARPWKKQPHAFQKRAIIQDAVFGLAAHLRPCWPRCFGPESLVPLGTQLSEGPALPGNDNGPTGPEKMGIQQEAPEQGWGEGSKTPSLKGTSLQAGDQIKDAYVTKHAWIHCGQTENHLEEGTQWVLSNQLASFQPDSLEKSHYLSVCVCVNPYPTLTPQKTNSSVT